MQPLDRTSAPIGTAVLNQARLVADDGSGTPVLNEGNALLPSDVQSLTLSVYDLQSQTPAAPVYTATLTPATVISSGLVLDNTWLAKPLADTIGRNFKNKIPGSTFSAPSHTYRIVYSLTTTGGSQMTFEYEHTTDSTAPG
jgi:hypothetical protein